MQRSVEWQYREVQDAVTELGAQMASQCGIAVVTTVDLLLLIRGAEAGFWSFQEVRQSLMRPGRVGVEPPGFRYAGYVRHFFDQPRVASIVVDHSATLRRGNDIIIRLADAYYGQRIESMQENRVDIDEARGGVIGIQTSLRRSDIGIGDYVFVRVQHGASIEEEIARMISDGCPNTD